VSRAGAQHGVARRLRHAGRGSVQGEIVLHGRVGFGAALPAGLDEFLFM